MTLLLLASYAQELSVLRCTPPTPRLATDTHRYRRDHAKHDHDTVESKHWTHAGGVDKVLQRLIDGEIDARGANGENNDDFARDLLMKSALKYRLRTGLYILPGSSPLRRQ
jgi:hypothetical protein